jgi:hypothetical protein
MAASFDNSLSMTSEKENLFPLPKDPPSRQDKVRTCLGLWKQGPLETTDQFAERVYSETMKAYRASKEAEQDRKARRAQAAYRACLQRTLSPKPEQKNSVSPAERFGKLAQISNWFRSLILVRKWLAP